jgi:hypothetical protein
VVAQSVFSELLPVDRIGLGLSRSTEPPVLGPPVELAECLLLGPGEVASPQKVP